MTEAEHYSEALEGFLTRSDNGWFTPVAIAIQGLSASQAASVPAERFNSVWGVVNHMRFWQEYMLLRLRGQEVDRAVLGAENGWPPIGDPTDEEAWERARERLLVVNQRLAKEVAGLSDEQLDQPYAAERARRWQVIQGILVHNAYHTCEIISIRHMLKLFLERT